MGITSLLVVVFVFYQRNISGVKKVSPKTGPIVEAIYGIGTVTPRHQFQFKVGQVSTVSEQFVQEGQEVKKGQPLLQLTGSVRISSPLDGTVVSLPYSVGENVFPDTPVVMVENIVDRYVLASLEQQGALRVKKGLAVKLNFETIRNQDFKGVVESIYPHKGQFLVRINVEKLPLEILPGMTADVSIEISKKDKALLIPLLAVNQGTVLIERQGQRKKISIKIGSTDSDWAEILDGDIQESDFVILRK